MTNPLITYDLSSPFLPLDDRWIHPKPGAEGWTIDDIARRRGMTVRELAIERVLYPALGRKPESGLKPKKTIQEMLYGDPEADELGVETAEMSARMRQMFTEVRSLEAFHETVLALWGNRGVIRFTPESEALDVYDAVATDVPLLNGFRLPLDRLEALDPESVVVLSAPNGISGYMHSPTEIAALAKRFYMVVLDERHSGFSVRKLSPMIAEWDNVMSVHRYPFSLPEQSEPIAWTVHPQSMHGFMTGVMPVPDQLQVDAFIGASGNDWREATRSAARLKGQLYRELRKLSLVSVPYPSWANYLLVQVERGDRETVVRGLRDRGMAVYEPPHANLQRHFRVTAVSPRATMALKQALIEINREM